MIIEICASTILAQQFTTPKRDTHAGVSEKNHILIPTAALSASGQRVETPVSSQPVSQAPLSSFITYELQYHYMKSYSKCQLFMHLLLLHSAVHFLLCQISHKSHDPMLLLQYRYNYLPHGQDSAGYLNMLW